MLLPDALDEILISRFFSRFDNVPRAAALDFDELAALLSTHTELTSKEGAQLWSPASYRPGEKRGNDGVKAVSCMVMDFDDGHDPEDFIEAWKEAGLTFIVYSSHSHTAAVPKWRAVFPMAAPVLGSEWERVWLKVEAALGFGLSDQACKDAARMYYLPSCGAGADRIEIVNIGKRFVDPAEYPELEVAQEEFSPSADQGDGTRPGDDFERRVSWDDILEPHGFVRIGSIAQWHGQTLYRRPGKTKGISLKVGPGPAGDRLYCWSPNAGLPQGKALKKFSVYAHLKYGSDFSAAGKALASEGYGGKAVNGGLSNSKPAEETPGPGKPPLRVEEGGQGPPEADPPKDDFDPTDLGIGKLYAETYGTHTRYVSEWGTWLHWQGHVWERDAPENPLARRKAHELVDQMNTPEWHGYDDKRLKWAGRCREGKRISAMLSEGKARPGIAIRPWALDREDWILPARNGIIDLRAGKLLPHDPDLLYTRCVPHDYDPDAKCPRFDQFLVEISKDRVDLVDLLLCLLGYSLTGSTKEHKWAVLYGERGRNGKSTLLEVVQRIMGDYCGLIDKALLLQSRFGEEARFSKAEIEGRRMIYASEARKGAAFNAEFIKDFVGASRLRAERKGKDGYEFDVKAKLWYAVNSFPKVDFDSAWTARIVPIPFEQSFYAPTDSEYEPGDLMPDRELSETLNRESSGILRAMVKGCLRWQEQGFPTVKSVAALVAEYKEANDHIGIWLAEEMAYEKDHRMRMSTCFSMYNNWAERMGIRKYLRVNEFAERMRQDKRLTFAKPNNKSTIYGLREADAQASMEME